MNQVSSRLWRPFVQRNVRNQWSKLSSLTQQWTSSSSSAQSHATSLVNAHLSHTYMPFIELGALSDMPSLRSLASSKLLAQQDLHRSKLLCSYRDMVRFVVQMIACSESMRCYLTGTSASPLLQFSTTSEDQNDLGDGGGVPVFTFWSIPCFEEYAKEIVEMFVRELNLKRLLVVELISIVRCGESSKMNEFKWTDELYPEEFDDLRVCKLFSVETCEPLFPRFGFSTSDNRTPRNPCPNQETLQVYLTTWLANVNIDTHRVDEIFAATSEEIHFNLS